MRRANWRVISFSSEAITSKWFRIAPHCKDRLPAQNQRVLGVAKSWTVATILLAEHHTRGSVTPHYYLRDFLGGAVKPAGRYQFCRKCRACRVQATMSWEV